MLKCEVQFIKASPNAMSQTPVAPVVMTVSANDCSGGAGLQADVEAIASMGCHAAPVVTAALVRDTETLKAVFPMSAAEVVDQARATLEDIPVAAIKLGALVSVEIIEAVHILLQDYRSLPLVLDPVLICEDTAAGGQTRMAEAMRELLLPLATMITPSLSEARKLAPEADSSGACAMALLSSDCEFVLLSGVQADTSAVSNRLYGNRRLLDTREWPRLPDLFHGAGATLSSALAGLLAQGQEHHTAAEHAQKYTWDALHAGYRIGMGRKVPNRLFWADANIESTE